VGLAESNPSNNNSQEWNVLDINGDDKADLIVPSEYQSTNGGTSQYGASVNPYWKVYLNSGITGVNDVVKDKNNSFFPNPTEDGIWMNAPMAGEFAVYTITGKCVYKQMLNQTQVYIDFHTLPSGTYITKLTGRDRILTEVLVKL